MKLWLSSRASSWAKTRTRLARLEKRSNMRQMLLGRETGDTGTEYPGCPAQGPEGAAETKPTNGDPRQGPT